MSLNLSIFSWKELRYFPRLEWIWASAFAAVAA